MITKINLKKKTTKIVYNSTFKQVFSQTFKQKHPYPVSTKDFEGSSIPCRFK